MNPLKERFSIVLLLLSIFVFSFLLFSSSTSAETTTTTTTTSEENQNPLLDSISSIIEDGLINHLEVPPPGVPAPPGASIPIMLSIFRYGVEKRIPLDSVTKISHLVNTVQTLFSDTRIEKFVSRTGSSITTVPLLKKLINGTKDIILLALGKEERFLWPAFSVGDEVKVEINGRMLTVRTVATRPRIFEIDNLLDPDECDHIIKKAQTHGMFRSRVGVNSDARTMDSARTSSQLWVGPTSKNDDKVFLGIRKRVFNLTKLPADLAEDTQVVYYDTMQHYYAHHDYTDKYMEDPYLAGGGNRLVTVLYYLNDVQSGGGTAFPLVNSSLTPETGLADKTKSCEYGIQIKPRKGGAAMFYSLQEEDHMDGNTDPWSLHAGCDVIKGEKWLANQWIRNKRVNGMLM